MHRETRKKRNQHITSAELDPRTVKKLLKEELAIKVRKPQGITNARRVACCDSRMTFSMWIMTAAFSEGLHPQMVWNWDATQFCCGATRS